MALIGIDDQFRGDVKIAQCVPELEGLRRGTFAVAVANDGERGGGDVPDEVDGGAFARRPAGRRRPRRRSTGIIH